MEGVLLSLPLLFASCGNGDNALEEIINGGGSGSGGGSTPSTIVATSLSITGEPLRFDISAPTSQALTLTVDPVDATITWESADETVATVDDEGNVTPKKAGTVTIKAKSGDLEDECTVYIYDKIVDISSGAASVTAGKSWLINGDGTAVANAITIGAGATVTLNGINISKQIECSGTATIILADGSTNTVANTVSYMPGIKIGTGTTTTLTIDAETVGDGQLTVQGGKEAAGIGTGCAQGSKSTGGNIVINGGTVKATGGEKAAGIGTGFSDKTTANPTSNTCGAITIGAGVKSVTATRGSGSPSPNSIGKGASEHGGEQICGTIKFGTLDVFNGSAWTTTMTDGNTYGGLKLAISGGTWTLTPAN